MSSVFQVNEASKGIDDLIYETASIKLERSRLKGR
jgi:hypothetical protein